MKKGTTTDHLQVVVPEPRRREPNSQNQNDLSKNAEDMQENNKVKVGIIHQICH